MSQRWVEVVITGRYPVFEESGAYPPGSSPAKVDEQLYSDQEVGLEDVVGWFAGDENLTVSFSDVVTNS